MLPIFPTFKKISRNSRNEILKYTKRFLPYSDYNFNSLWAWNTNGEMKFSVLNDNLVVTMPDYTTGIPILSFIGVRRPTETALELLTYAERKSISTGLTFVPEVTASKLSSNSLVVEEDRQHFDYIFSTQKLAKLNGKAYKAKRHLAKRFKTAYPEAHFVIQPLSIAAIKRQVLSVLEIWEKHKESEETLLENRAISRLLKLTSLDKNQLMVSGVYVDNELIAFSIDEILNNGYALSHFFKVNYDYRGVSEFINQNTAAYLHDQGVELWSWEQDLAIEGLRASKLSYRPVQFLKKYNVILKK